MFKFICCFAFISAASAASVGAGAGVRSPLSVEEKREIIPLLRFESERTDDGFQFSYEGGDKSFREESAKLVNAGTEDEALEVVGSYRYIDADGELIEVHYTAGKNGFVPVGTHIPGEISALAKAAADLPNIPDEYELRRKGRSQTEEEKSEPENVPVKPKTKA